MRGWEIMKMNYVILFTHGGMIEARQPVQADQYETLPSQNSDFFAFYIDFLVSFQ